MSEKNAFVKTLEESDIGPTPTSKKEIEGMRTVPFIDKVRYWRGRLIVKGRKPDSDEEFKIEERKGEIIAKEGFEWDGQEKYSSNSLKRLLKASGCTISSGDDIYSNFFNNSELETFASEIYGKLSEEVSGYEPLEVDEGKTVKEFWLSRLDE